MTLVMVWRDSEFKLNMASDSRLTFPGLGVADAAMKVMNVPVSVFSPLGDREPKARLAYRRSVGLAFVGSLTTTYIVKQTLESLVSNLQAAPGWTDESLDGLCQIVVAVFQQLARPICAVLHNGGLGGLVLVGYCPEQQRDPLSAKIQ